ncbi:MAG: serine/threonine-protein kinase [Thermoanaerobaculia bacterium]
MADHPETVGGYIVTEVLDREASGGAVYKARERGGAEPVVVKVLDAAIAADPERLGRFHQQVEAARALHHPNLVRILDAGADGARVWVAREFFDGTTLADLRRRRDLGVRESLSILKEVASGLAAIHAAGHVHGNLNPRSILVSPNLKAVKIADFGLTGLEPQPGEGTMATRQTRAAAIHYMAPERALSPDDFDARADVYSAGAVLFELLTGRLPTGRLDLPSQQADVPPEVDPVVLRCLNTDAGGRYTSGGELLGAFAQLEDQLRFGLVHDLQGMSRSTSRWLKGSGARSRKALWIGLALLGLAAAGVVGFLLAG